MKINLFRNVSKIHPSLKLFLLIMLALPLQVFAQSHQVRGVVIDERNQPLIGVNITVKNATKAIGSVTDIDGNYSLSVPNTNSTLVFSYVGYLSTEQTINSREIINVTMKEDYKALEEVVVIGFGTQRKVNLTGAIASVDKKLLEDRPISNVSAGLAGTMPGVSVAQRSGLPGADGGTIRVRGVGTLNNSNPMIIIDGVEEATMAHLDAHDIESISVLKDAASAAIYGSKASNGVILITTKRGERGRTKINYSGYFGWQSATDKPKYMKSLEYAELYNEALRNNDRDVRFTSQDIQDFKDGKRPDTDWQDLLYQGSGFQTGHSASMAGGTENIKYMSSIGYLKQDGIIKHSGKEQYNFRTNIDVKAASNLDIGFNMSYTRMDLEQPTNSYVGSGSAPGGSGVDQIIRQVNRLAPWIPYKTKDGYYGVGDDGNPIAWLDLNQKQKKQRDYFTGIGSIDYKPIQDLSIKGVFSYKTYNQDENEFIKDIQYNPSKYHGPNRMYQRDSSNETVMGDIYATYDKTLAEKHNFSVMGGFHTEYYHEKYREAYRQNFPSNNIGDIDGGSLSGMSNKGYTRELAMLSWFGRATYNYDSRYLLEANVRYDGTSRFAKGNRWGAFPSLSAAWRISEEAFMESSKHNISNLKLRASWGKLGNQSALTDGLNSYYPTIYTLTLNDQSYPLGGQISSGGATRAAKNPDLKWETSRTWDFGLDFGLTNGFSFAIDYYNRLTSDILMQLPTPDTYALDDYWANVGEVENRGIEFSVNYNKTIGNVELSFGGNTSYNKNEIKSLGGQNDILDGRIIKRIGNSINSIYGYQTDGLYQSKEDIASWVKNNNIGGTVRPGDLRYVDINNDGILDARDRVVLGSSDPKYTFAINLGATYKGFDFLVFFQGVADVAGYLETEAYGNVNGDDGKATTFWRDRWTPNNPNATVPRVSSDGPNAHSAATKTSSFWVQNGNYLRMKNIQIGYSFPKSLTQKMHIEKLRLYYSGQNLFTITNFAKGWDPEAPIGRGSHYPQVMVNSIGVNVTF